MSDKSLVCWKCGVSLEKVPRPITRHSNCPSCYAELHCCVMCKSFDTRYTSKCNDERADPPIYKDTANFCEFFKPLPNAFDPGQDQASKQAQAELNAIFGENDDPAENPREAEGEADDAPMSDEDKARQELEKLFRK